MMVLEDLSDALGELMFSSRRLLHWRDVLRLHSEDMGTGQLSQELLRISEIEDFIEDEHIEESLRHDFISWNIQMMKESLGNASPEDIDAYCARELRNIEEKRSAISDKLGLLSSTAELLRGQVNSLLRELFD